MINKKNILIINIVGIGLCIFIFFIAIGNKSKNNSSSIAETIERLQEAIKEDNFERHWGLLGSVRRGLYENNYNKFKEDEEKWFQEYPKDKQDLINFHMGEIKTINPDRAWVYNKKPSDFKGLYMVKENGKWKYGNLSIYGRKIFKDFKLINEAIKKYFSDTNVLPYTLNDLVPEYLVDVPVDPFSDEKKMYTYEITGERSWRIYSIGIDNHDDLGLMHYMIYQPLRGDFGIGDIIIEESL